MAASATKGTKPASKTAPSQMKKTAPAAPAANPGYVRISRGILSYPKLFTPEPGPNGGEAKYGCTVVIEKDGEDHTALKRAAIHVAKEEYGAEKAASMIKNGKLKMPFIVSTDDDGYPEGTVYIRPRTKKKPGVVSRFPSKENPKVPARITDPDEMYPGAIVSVSVSAFAYDVNGNKGISFALNNVQKIAEGERLAGGGPAAEDEFTVDEDAMVDLDSFENEETAENEDAEEGGAEEEDLSDLIG